MKKDICLWIALISFVMMTGDCDSFITWILWELVWGVIGIISVNQCVKE